VTPSTSSNCKAHQKGCQRLLAPQTRTLRVSFPRSLPEQSYESSASHTEVKLTAGEKTTRGARWTSPCFGVKKERRWQPPKSSPRFRNCFQPPCHSSLTAIGGSGQIKSRTISFPSGGPFSKCPGPRESSESQQGPVEPRKASAGPPVGGSTHQRILQRIRWATIQQAKQHIRSIGYLRRLGTCWSPEICSWSPEICTWSPKYAPGRQKYYPGRRKYTPVARNMHLIAKIRSWSPEICSWSSEMCTWSPVTCT
jgi:hypothetical protein